jgi:uroporphyrinogen decarboxylase
MAPSQENAAFPHFRVIRSIWGTWRGIESYGEEFDRPLRLAEAVSEVDAYPWPNPDWFDYSKLRWFTDPEGFAYTVPQWAEHYSGYARIIGGWSPIFSRIMDLCGMQTGLMHMAARPDLIHAMAANIGEYLEAYYQHLVSACHGYADIVCFGDDFASQNGLMLRPERWREFFLPWWRRLFAVAHEHHMLTMMHSRGSVRSILGDLVDAGLDILEVVQVRARGMDPSELKREFGAHLGFYGGIDVQALLPYGSPQEIRDEVRRLASLLGASGRYILAPSHYIMDDVPEENVLALYDEALHYIAPTI